AGAIAREHPASAVGPVSAGREANEEQAGTRVAESGNGFRPIFAIPKSPALHARDVGAVFHQSWTFVTGNDLLVQDFQGLHAALKFILPGKLHAHLFE